MSSRFCCSWRLWRSLFTSSNHFRTSPIAELQELDEAFPDAARSSGNDSRTSQNRLVWVDVAKGIGIVLVVYGHALRGFWGERPWPSWTITQDSLIYAFHMPLFFVIAGLFLWNSIERGKRQFIKGRWWAIIYPYLLWSLVCGGIEVAASRFANTPMSLKDLLLIPVVPVEQFWFLYALLIVQLVAVACYPSRAAVVVAAALGLAIVAFTGATTIFQIALRFLPFLAIGVCCSALIGKLSASRTSVQAWTFALSWLIFALVYLQPYFEPWSTLALGCTGALGCLSGAMLVANAPTGAALALLGQASLTIYVLHTLFSAGLRAGFVMLHIDRYALWTLAPEAIIGLLLPLPLWWWSRSSSRGYLLGFGAAPIRSNTAELSPAKVEPLGA